jgi:hypothetical protein
VPTLRHASIIRSWSGIESYLPDELPVMGPSSRHDGLFYAFGFCGHGFQTGPGVGDMMAELIATDIDCDRALLHSALSDIIDGKGRFSMKLDKIARSERPLALSAGGSAQGIHEKSSKSMGTENPVLTRSITTIVLKPLMSGFS